MPRKPALALLALASLACTSAPAMADETWRADPFQALITLPAPQPGSPVKSALMSCAGQVWTLTLSTEEGATVAGSTGTALLSVPRETFETPSKSIAGGIEILVPNRALEPMKAAISLSVGFAGGTDEIRFPLAGSRRAITAAEGLCSDRIMPLANSAALTPYSSYLMLARRLRKSDIADFELSTASKPAVRAGMVEIGDGRRLLLAELCGSAWYYGVSGCNLTGYAPVEGEDAASGDGWRPVYESEGAFLYIDPDIATDGWPDLLTYPLKGDGVETRWSWSDGRYVQADTLLSAVPAEAIDESVDQ